MHGRAADLNADRRDDRGGPKGPRRSILSGVLGKTKLLKHQNAAVRMFASRTYVRSCGADSILRLAKVRLDRESLARVDWWRRWLRVFVEGVVIVGSILLAFGL